MGTFVSDLRTALRSLVHRPAFTAVAVLTLALGIGANSAIPRLPLPRNPDVDVLAPLVLVAPVKHEGRESARERAVLYQPWQQRPQLSGFLAVRTRSGPAAAVALLSSWLPARRATRVNPTVALRQE